MLEEKQAELQAQGQHLCENCTGVCNDGDLFCDTCGHQLPSIPEGPSVQEQLELILAGAQEIIAQPLVLKPQRSRGTTVDKQCIDRRAAIKYITRARSLLNYRRPIDPEDLSKGYHPFSSFLERWDDDDTQREKWIKEEDESFSKPQRLFI